METLTKTKNSFSFEITKPNIFKQIVEFYSNIYKITTIEFKKRNNSQENYIRFISRNNNNTLLTVMSFTSQSFFKLECNEDVKISIQLDVLLDLVNNVGDTNSVIVKLHKDENDSEIIIFEYINTFGNKSNTSIKISNDNFSVEPKEIVCESISISIDDLANALRDIKNLNSTVQIDCFEDDVILKYTNEDNLVETRMVHAYIESIREYETKYITAGNFSIDELIKCLEELRKFTYDADIHLSSNIPLYLVAHGFNDSYTILMSISNCSG